MKVWFGTLGYGFESYSHTEGKHFEWIVTIPTRRNYERIFVRGVEREADISDVIAVREAVQKYKVDEGWVVAPRRVSQLAKQEVQKSINEHNVYCYTFDELIDQEVDFSKYFEWLEQQVEKQKINVFYVPLACTKEEVDPTTKQRLGISFYTKENGWIDGYINRWLDDPSKEHISILGEFGTGKTWFALHYAWTLLQKYLRAKQEGTERPRIPLVISLRDYAKAVSVESLFSEFFFRKHQIELRGGYPTFEQLNRMGKLLLIFDGFDEMAARVSWQDMINNFWELAKVVVPGAKAILTCRTEHFPEAKEGRAILNAELKASTANLTGEPPQFEVLELEKLNDEQISKVLSLQANPETINKILRNSQLVDLARRPVMIDLIVEALPAIETGKQLDIARVYLYAIWQKMQRDIKQERTFTSMVDKLYFLCELAWEMLSTDKLSLNYREFPERIRNLFGTTVREQRDLDHWHYDMMGQTILTRNSLGDYTFAHRSFLEFFVAYKIAAELGIMTDDFIEIFQEEFDILENPYFCSYTWSQYFEYQKLKNTERNPNPKFGLFNSEEIDVLKSSFGCISLATAEKAILELVEPMIEKSEATITKLLDVIEKTKGMNLEESGYLGGNAVTLLLKCHSSVLSGKDLSRSVIVNADLTTANLSNTNFASAHLDGCVFAQTFGSVFSLIFSPHENENFLALGDATGTIRLFDINDPQSYLIFKGHQGLIRSIMFSSDGETLASGSEDGTVRLWNSKNGQCLLVLDQHTKGIWAVLFDSNDKVVASGADGVITIWDYQNNSSITLQGHTNRIRSIAIDRNRNILASGSEDTTIRLWDMNNNNCISVLEGHNNWIRSVAISSDGKLLASGSEDQVIKVWNISEARCLNTWVGSVSFTKAIAFSKDGRTLASSSQENSIKLWSVDEALPRKVLLGHSSFVRSLSFSSDDTRIISGSDDGSIKIWDTESGKQIRTLTGHTGWVNSVSSNDRNSLVVSGGEDKIVRIWDIKSSRCLRELNGHTDGIRAVTFCLEGKRIASGSADRSVKIWDASDGRCITTLKGHQDWIISVAFSHCGRLLATGSSGKNIKVWNLESSQQILEFNEHQDWVYSVLFSPDDSSLISNSRDGTIKIWSIASGKCTKTINQNLLPLSGTFNSQGSMAACGCEDGAIRLWSIKDSININLIYDRAYEGMNIFDVKGLTSSQIATLKELGASDKDTF
ncbi:NACHT and WD40 repeat domain-containing protein [Leptolyngbya ohadii]|uniref:NACHT and WD40 repeat domain-containing protein n=1 Tax=Leptolyngbya ohadii TaxID=1962290 RepID=UPI000B5A1D83|nr:pentapeptide repeat-containing protein [Leptolyngbya ohadii]